MPICLSYGKIPNVLVSFVFSYYFWRLSLYFLEIIMLISFVGTLTLTRMGVGRVTFPGEGAHEGPTCIPYDKIPIFVL